MALMSEADLPGGKGGARVEDDEDDIGLPEGVQPKDEDVAGDEIEVEIADDTPPEDRGRKPLNENPEPSDEELEEYSEKVKARIAKMRHGFHDERRAKEAAMRERDEAVAIAQRILAEKKELENRTKLGESAYVAQATQRIDLAIAEAKRAYKDAYEAGDSDKLADAQERLSLLAVEKKQAEAWAQRQTEAKLADSEDVESALQRNQSVVQKQQPQSQQAQVVDEDAQKWVERNDWFQKDKVMTAVAYAVHDELIASGIDPKYEPSEYYGTIDKRMRETFPNYKWADRQQKPKTHTNVASVSRTTKTAKRVVLTQTQVALARRLGITPEQYASELAKMEK